MDRHAATAESCSRQAAFLHLFLTLQKAASRCASSGVLVDRAKSPTLSRLLSPSLLGPGYRRILKRPYFVFCCRF